MNGIRRKLLTTGAYQHLEARRAALGVAISASPRGRLYFSTEATSLVTFLHVLPVQDNQILAHRRGFGGERSYKYIPLNKNRFV